MEGLLVWLVVGTVHLAAQGVLGDACSLATGEPIGLVEDPELEEMSALAASRVQPEILWTLNDHGGPNSIYAVSYFGEKLLEAKLDNADNIDWEDLAIIDTMIGESFIYVADTGNNDFDRNPVRVFRFAEPAVDKSQTRRTITIDKDAIQELKVSWPDQIYDCEAITLDQSNGDLYFFTKDRVNTISEVYRYPAPQDPSITFQLEHVAQLPCFWVTGADLSPNGKYLGLTNKQFGYGWELPEGSNWFEYLSTAPEPCILEFVDEEQRESIALTDTGIWTTSECKSCFLWYYERI